MEACPSVGSSTCLVLPGLSASCIGSMMLSYWINVLQEHTAACAWLQAAGRHVGSVGMVFRVDLNFFSKLIAAQLLHLKMFGHQLRAKHFQRAIRVAVGGCYIVLLSTVLPGISCLSPARSC